MAEAPGKGSPPANSSGAKELTPYEILSTSNIPPHTDDQASTNHYRLKRIRWRRGDAGERQEVKIVTQNENGPCPLIALANSLVLLGRLSLGRRPSISAAELVGVLGEALFGNSGVASDDVDEILGLLPRLTEGLDVEIRFTDVFGFVEGPATRLFRAFGVPMVHGWVVEEEDEVGGIIRERCRGSYSGLVDYVFRVDAESGGRVIGNRGEDMGEDVRDAVLANMWLESNRTQLTEYGRRRLLDTVEDHGVAVFFRNNHFSTLCKRPDGLFVLCADDGVAGDSRVVWESICDVQQQGNLFFDSDFSVLSSRNGDYVLEATDEDQKQVDEDYALAVELQQQEDERQRERARAQALQVRQADRMPPGMVGGSLYGVPRAARDQKTDRAGRSASVDDFERRMTRD
ncbi:Ubiquitin carboxyl-terminal hydrolase MINDY-2, partial [Coemansia sp. RSA 2599]